MTAAESSMNMNKQKFERGIKAAFNASQKKSAKDIVKDDPREFRKKANEQRANNSSKND